MSAREAKGTNMKKTMGWLAAWGAGVCAAWGSMFGPVVTGPEDGLWVEGEAGTLEAEARNCGDFAVALAEEVSDGVTNVVSLEMVGIEPGSFTMGSPEGETGRDDEGNHERQHEVVLSHGFWLGRYEVTQEQYAALMGGNPSRHGGEGLPVECVTWADAKAFCAKLTDREKKAGRLPEGYVYSLPTEAQWEYACRAGTTAALNSGMNLTNAAVDDAAGEVAWYAGNAEGTQAVGQKPGNGWGLYDMHGNVAEWCADGPWEYPAGGTTTDPAGAVTNGQNVVRGGSYMSEARQVRSAAREFEGWRTKSEVIGFRVALVPSRDRDCTVTGDEGKALLELVWCPPGSFTMGSPRDETGREPEQEGTGDPPAGMEPQHVVTLTQGFWIGKYEVTWRQYLLAMGMSLSLAEGDPDSPAYGLSWRDATNFLYRLTGAAESAGWLQEGWEFALPTEAQWEYACRASTTNALNNGEELADGDECEVMNEVGWYVGNSAAGGSDRRVHPGGELRPNAWGIYDMHGNVWEWCEDWFEEELSADAAVNPSGPSYPLTAPGGAGLRVLRGGSWDVKAQYCRAAMRSGKAPSDGGTGTGLRAVLRKKRDVTVVASDSGTTNTMKLLWVKPGSFWMGSPESELGRSEDEVMHDVELSKGFWLGRREVTQGMYEKVVGSLPDGCDGHGKGPDLPVYGVSREEALIFCDQLTRREREAGLIPDDFAYTLPTEAQWEYACRAGTTKALNNDQDLTYVEACTNADHVAWYAHTATNQVHSAELAPNEWDFVDMHGNVEEWVLDLYGDYPWVSVTDPTGPDSGLCILRGGSYASEAAKCRSAARHEAADKGTPTSGFRVALVALDDGADPDEVYPVAAPELAPWQGVRCQWFKGGEAIEGATGKVYEIASMSADDEGWYWLEASNGFGTATGRVAKVVLDTRMREEVDGVLWYYVEGADGGATVVGAEPAEGELAMPATLGGLAVTAVGDEAFANCTGLQGMVLAEGVAAIGDGAFMNCGALEWVRGTEGVEAIGDGAFKDSGLVEVELPGLKSAGAEAFCGCTYLERCVTGGELAGIPMQMFSGCSNLQSFAIADAATEIGALAFHSCTTMTNLFIGGSVSNIATLAITNCGALAVIDAPIELQPTDWTLRQQLKDATVKYYGLQTVTFDAAGGTCNPATGKFDVRGTYEPLPVPEKQGCVFFGWFTEEGAPVKEGDEVKPVPARTFTAHWREGSGQVVEGVTWAYTANEDGIGATVAGAVPLEGAAAMPAVLGGLRVEAIADGAFAGSRGLTAMEIPASVVEVGTNAFAECRMLKWLTVPAFLEGTDWGDGGMAEVETYPAQLVVFDANGGVCAVVRAGYRVDVEESATYGWLPVAEWPPLHEFAGWWTAADRWADPVTETNIVTEETTRTLYAHWQGGVRTNDVFWRCTTNVSGGLTVTGADPTAGNMVMPDELAGYAVTAVGAHAFDGCSNLTGMAMAEGVTDIGSHAFASCDGLTDARIGNGVRNLDEGAFAFCGSLTNAWLGTGIESVGVQVFFACTNLAAVWVPVEKKGMLDLLGASVPEECIRYYGTQVVTFDAGVGTCPVAMNGYEIGKAYGPLPEASREGGRFAGWFDADGTRVTAESTVTEEAARTLYAKWAAEETVDGVTWFYTIETVQGQPAAVVWGAAPAEGRLCMPGALGGCDIGGVGAGAFAGEAYLTGMAMAPSVQFVGEGAFAGSALAALRLPDAVEPVGEGAFAGCEALESAWIGPETQTVGTNAFAGCTNLLVVWLDAKWQGRTDVLLGAAGMPEGVEYRFYGRWDGEGGTVAWRYWIDGEGHATILGAEPAEGAMVMPASLPVTEPSATVTAVGDEAFRDCAGLTAMELPAGVAAIGSYAFGRSGLEAVVLPEGLTELGEGAFRDCAELAEAVIGSKLAAIPARAFERCVALRGVELPEGVESIGEFAFAWSGLEAVELPDSLKNLAPGAFAFCNALTDVAVPGGVAEVEPLAFAGCSNLVSAVLAEGVRRVGMYAFQGCTALTNLVLPDGLGEIGPYAFWRCTAVTNVVLPDSLRELGEGAFAYCMGLKGVTIPEGLAEIGPWAFQGCSSMTWALIPDGVANIAEGAFAKSGILNGKTPDSITNIADCAWFGCPSMQEAWIGKGVEKVGRGALAGCPKLNLVFVHARWKDTDFLDAAWDETTNAAPKPEGVTIWYYDDEQVDGIAWRWSELPNGKSVVVFGAKPAAGNLVMPEKLGGLPVTMIATDAFKGCLELTGMDIASGVTVIGYQAFARCPNLVSVTLPEGLKTIHEAAFWKTGLTEVAVPAGVAGCGDYAFSECPALAKATFGDGLPAFGQGVFMLSPALAEVAIPDSVTDIPAGAFYGCSSLTNVAIPQNVTNIGYGAFAFSGLTYARIPDAVRTVDDCVFWGCPDLLLAYIGSGVESVGAEAFADCSALREVWLDVRWKDTAFLDGTWGEGGAPKPDTVNLRYYGDLDYYVRADGDDANDGLSPATAKREIFAALALAGPGNTVHVGPGTYGPAGVPQCVKLVSDAGAEKTVIRGAKGARCLMVGVEAFVKGFTLRDGDATANGGGAWMAAGSRMERCIIRDCKTAKRGGAVIAANNAARWKVTLENCLIVRNEAGAEGAAAAEGVILSHCTVADNAGPGARDCPIGGSIVWGNTGATQAVACIVEYSLCEGAEGLGDIEGDPLFVGGGDWHLQGSSPCIDAMPRLTPPVTDDLDGAPRPQPGTYGTGAEARPDMGCYEFTPKGLFVSPGATGQPPYDSWENAAPDLQSAADVAQDGDIIVVDAGTYAPVSVGPAVTLVSLRGPEETVIDAGGALRAVELLGGGTLEGFTIVNGSADKCGGILAENGSTVRDVIVRGCRATGSGGGGGGVCLYTGSTAENVTADGNTAAFGGGFYADKDARIESCTIVSNTATRSGGGAWLAGGSLLRDSTLRGNTARENGGGVWIGPYSLLHNNLVEANAAGIGGGIFARGADGRDSILAGNTAEEAASALWLEGCSEAPEPSFWNLTIVGNTNNAGGCPVELRTESVLGNSIIFGNGIDRVDDEESSTVESCFTDDPSFLPAAPGELACHLSAASACIGAGTVVLPMMADAYDIDGQPRLVLTSPGEHDPYQVDIGADSATLDAIAAPTHDSPYGVWRVIPGSRLQLQSCTSLGGEDVWQDLGDSFTVFDSTWSKEDPLPGPGPRFYRLLWIR